MVDSGKSEVLAQISLLPFDSRLFVGGLDPIFGECRQGTRFFLGRKVGFGGGWPFSKDRLRRG